MAAWASFHSRPPTCGWTARELASRAYQLLDSLPQDLRPADPGRKLMFDDRLHQPALPPFLA